MNNRYKIKVEAPLIRPGITIETEVSERYVVPVVNKIMEIIREINGPAPVDTRSLKQDMDFRDKYVDPRKKYVDIAYGGC